MAIPREVPIKHRDPVETTRRRLTKAYLLGALHDATKRKTTYRIGTDSKKYAQFLKKGVENLGYRAWVYKEGQTRNYYIVEFSKFVLNNLQLVSIRDKLDYIRGYFDTDGAVARSKRVRYYLYFSQKNLADLKQLKEYLKQVAIFAGVIHNPSKKDPMYFRFFIKANSYLRFAKIVGSWHPVKSKFVRMKI